MIVWVEFAAAVIVAVVAVVGICQVIDADVELLKHAERLDELWAEDEPEGEAA